MKSSKQSRREAKDLFRACLAQGRLDEGRARRAVQLVLEQKPRGYLGMLEHFRRLIQLEAERRKARVDSAVPLSRELQSSITQKLTSSYGAGLDIVFDVNPALIGGLRVRVGSDILDGSVQGRLQALADQF
jgi:F-type H+-transporting ATPase subunit delta